MHVEILVAFPPLNAAKAPYPSDGSPRMMMVTRFRESRDERTMDRQLHWLEFWDDHRQRR